MNTITINFDKDNGLVPCVVQDAVTHRVLMLGYMNLEAYQKTKMEKRVTFFSRSKKRLWTKGETSGNYLELVDILHDCDQDTLLVKVHPKGPACHTGADTCFNEVNSHWGLSELEKIIRDRKVNPRKDSYTSQLFEAGINRIAQKVGEEATELIIEAKDDDRERFLNEAADVMFHFLVLLAQKGYSMDDVSLILEKRQKSK